MPDSAAAGGLRYQFENVEYDEIAAALRVDGLLVGIEPRPLQVLGELLRHAGEVVTKEELFDSVWDGRPTVDNVLANAISKLRGVLGEAGAARIVTVPRVGYRLTGAVQRFETRAAPQAFEAGQPVPGRVGYVLERPLGQGSRSDVWLARHAKLGQAHVFKFADDGARLTALKREYTLYRVLKRELGPRDDFAVVIDSNFAAAPYFLECQYGGLSLLEWAAEDSRLETLSRADRLTLFLQITCAVSAAHSVGVLHKDLKPGNILVAAASDGNGPWQARLTDFGSGRLLDASRLEGLQLTAVGLTQTQDGLPDSRSGTLLYLAPEVMAGQAPSTQSDVYALGLILYQLLVGDLRRPLSTGWEREIDDELLREDIRAATEGEPRVRIGSAGELAARLGQLPARHALRMQEQLSARHNAAVQADLQRQQARRPWVMGSLALLAAGLVGTLAFYARERAALASAQVQTKRADAVVDFLTKDVLTADDLAQVGGRKPATVLDVLKRGAANASVRFADQPMTEALVRQHLSQVYLRLSAPGEAYRQIHMALEVVRKLGDGNRSALLPLLLQSVVVDIEVHSGDEAVKAMAEAEQLAAGRLNTGSSDLALDFQRSRAALLLYQDKVDEALAATESLFRESQQKTSLPLDARFEIGRMRAQALMAHQDRDQAHVLISQLAMPPFGVENVGPAAFVNAHIRLAEAQLRAGRWGDADELMRAALQKLEAQAVPSPWHVGLALNLLAQIDEHEGRFKASEQHLQRALAAMQDVLGDDHPFVSGIEQNLAIAHLHNSQWREALALCERRRAWMGAHAPRLDLLDLNALQARALIGLKRPAEALALLPASLGLPKAPRDDMPQDDFRQIARAFRGMALIDLGRIEEGRALIAATLHELKPSGVPSPAFEKSWDTYLQPKR